MPQCPLKLGWQNRPIVTIETCRAHQVTDGIQSRKPHKEWPNQYSLAKLLCQTACSSTYTAIFFLHIYINITIGAIGPRCRQISSPEPSGNHLLSFIQQLEQPPWIQAITLPYMSSLLWRKTEQATWTLWTFNEKTWYTSNHPCFPVWYTVHEFAPRYRAAFIDA